MTAEEYYDYRDSIKKFPFNGNQFMFAESYSAYLLQYYRNRQQNGWMPTEEEWKQFPDAKWAAMDRDGWVFMHPDNPTCRTRFWIFGNGSCIPLKQVSPVNMDWTKCKVERPEEV